MESPSTLQILEHNYNPIWVDSQGCLNVCLCEGSHVEGKMNKEALEFLKGKNIILFYKDENGILQRVKYENAEKR